LGFGDDFYITRLKKLACGGGIADRFILLPPVQWSEVPDYISSADCAIILYEDNCLNNLYCSPSKLFDALIAGVPIVGYAGNPLVADILQELDAGVCISKVSPVNIASAIVQLLSREDLPKLRERFKKRASEKYTWESQESELIRLFNTIDLKKG